MNKIIKLSKNFVLKSQKLDKSFKFSSGQSELLKQFNKFQYQIKLPQQNNIIQIFNQVLNIHKGLQKNVFQYSTVNNHKKEDQVLLKANSSKNEIKSQNQQKLNDQPLKNQQSSDQKLSLKTDGVKNESKKNQQIDKQKQEEESQKNKQYKKQNNETDKMRQNFIFFLKQFKKKIILGLSSRAWNGIAVIIGLSGLCFTIYGFLLNRINKIEQNLRIAEESRIKTEQEKKKMEILLQTKRINEQKLQKTMEQEKKKMEILLQTKSIHEQKLQKTIEQDKKLINTLTQTQAIQIQQLKKQNQSNYMQAEKSQLKKCQQAQRKYSKFQQKKQQQIRNEYIAGQYVEQQLKKIIQQNIGNLLTIIAGVPGIGKSTALYYLVSNWRKQNKKVYYMSLFGELKKDIQQLNNLLQGIQLKYEQILKKSEKIILIIDDINKLDKMKNEQQYTSLLSKIIKVSQFKKLELVCVSSSSHYTEELMKNRQIIKYAQFKIIQDLDEEKYPEFARKVIKKFEPNFSPKLINQIIEKQYSLRDTEILISKLKEFNQQQAKIKSIQSEYDIKKRKRKNLIDSIMRKILNQSLRHQLTEGIKESKKKLRQENCDQIIQKIRDNHKENVLQVYNLRDITRELDQRNAINFCRPRSKLERQAFQMLYNEWKSDKKKQK